MLLDTRRLALMVAALLVLTVAACAGGAGAPTATELYVADAPGGAKLMPLDPGTLADRPDAAPLDLGSPAWDWVLSGDGSTLAGLEHRPVGPAGLQAGEVAAIVVRDAATGAERGRFAPPADVVSPRLSRDGGRLVLDRRGSAVESYVVGTTDGRLLTRVRTEGPRGSVELLDPGARRMYRLVATAADPGDPTGPGSARIIAVDLAAGAEVGWLDLPDVAAGGWRSGRSIAVDVAGYTRREPIDAVLWPGAAISPDGRWLAVVHADADRVTLVDAAPASGYPLAVERTVVLRRPVSLWDRLPFVPRPAWAKLSEGVRRAAVFGPDGRRLYVWGSETTVGEDGKAIDRGRELMAVDPARGRVLAAALPGERVDQVLPAPDGRSLYLTQPGTLPDPPSRCVMDRCPIVLRRLDADTLEVLAERALTGYRRVVVRPSEPARLGATPTLAAVAP